MEGTGERTALGVLAQQIIELHGHEVVTLSRPEEGKVLAAILPRGMSVEDLQPLLDQYLPVPLRRTGTAQLTDVDSFLAFMDRFVVVGAKEVAVFADPTPAAPSLTVVFDYHNATATNWAGHRGVYKPALSPSWKTWMAANNKPMSQGDFAEFIEANITDVIVPNFDDPKLKLFADLVGGRFAEPTDLIALSRGLQVSVDATLKQAVTLNTGEISLQYSEQHKDGEGAPIKVANLFQICIPVFYGDALYRIPVRLRYRVVQQRLTWHYLIMSPERVFDDAFNGIVKKVRESGVPVFLGAPEK